MDEQAAASAHSAPNTNITKNLTAQTTISSATSKSEGTWKRRNLKKLNRLLQRISRSPPSWRFKIVILCKRGMLLEDWMCGSVWERILCVWKGKDPAMCADRESGGAYNLAVAIQYTERLCQFKARRSWKCNVLTWLNWLTVHVQTLEVQGIDQ